MKFVALLIITLITSTSSNVPPETWQENWYEHKMLLTRTYYDNHIAVYFDKDTDKAITWMNPLYSDVWAYVQKLYGEFGDDSRLYLIFHTGRYGGYHFATHFDSLKSHRNVVECGKKGNWTTPDGEEIDSIIWHAAFIVQNANQRTQGSPSWHINAFAWFRIFIYDIFLGIGRKEHAQRFYERHKLEYFDNPKPKTYWLRDWFFPIYDQYGPKVLNRFFELQYKYYPRENNKYSSSSMTFGEYVHFWSGATQVNLKGLANEAFGWNETFEGQFQEARKRFPHITYYNIVL